MNVAQLTIEMAANVARLKTDMAAARNTVEGTMNSIKKAAGLAQTALGGIGAALSVRELVRAMDAYTKFNAQLKLSTSSAEQYAKAQESVRLIAKEAQSDISAIGVLYSRISNATKELNISQSQVVDVTRSVGLALKVSGATAQESASAMLQLSQAFGSGLLRGEEFNAVNEAAPRIMKALADGMGVPIGQLRKMASEGQITAKIMAEALPLALQDLIKEAQNVQTITGAFQTLKNEILLFVGATGEANNVTGFLAGTLNDLSTIFGVLNAQTSDATGNMQALKFVQDGIATVFETVIALGVNVSYVLSQIGNEIGGIAAQIASVFRTGSLDEARAIREMMVKDAEAARAQVDKTTEAIINSRKNNVASMQMLDHYSKENVKSLMGVAGASEKAAKEAEKLAKAQDKARQAATELVASIAFETETMQMSNLEREIANNLLKLEKTGLQENTDEYRAYAEAIRLATIENEGIKQRIKLEKEAADKRKKIEEDYAREVEQINFQIGQSLTDALINGGQTAKEFLINMFKTLILRPILQPIIQGGTAMVMSALGMSGTANAASGTGSLLSTSNLGSIASMASSVNNAYTALTSATLGALDSIAAGAQAATFAVGEALTAAGFESAGSAVFGSAGTVGLAAQGAAGVAAGTLAGEWISAGKSIIGGNSLYTTGGGALAGATIGTIILPGIGTAIGGLIGGIVGGITNAAFGSGQREYGGMMASGTITGARGISDPLFYRNWTQEGGWFGGGGSGREVRGMDAELSIYIGESAQAIQAAARQYADFLKLSADGIENVAVKFDFSVSTMEELNENLGKSLDEYTNKVAESILAGTNYAKANETAYQTLQRLVTNLNGVNAVFGTLGLKLYDTSAAGGAAASAFIDMLGGIEAFNQATDFYYQNFYTQAERTAKTTENLTGIFKSMNLELPESREAFRAMVEAARAAGDDQLLAGLLNLAPTFASVTTAIDETAVALEQAAVAGRTAAQILSERESLEMRLLQTQGNTAAIRERELAALDESNRAIQLQIWALEDQKVAAELAAEAAAQAAKEQEAAARSLEELAAQAAAGSEAAAKALLDYANKAFVKLQQSIKAQMDSELETLQIAYDGLIDNLNKQKTAMQAARDVAAESVSTISSLFDMLGEQVKDIVGSVLTQNTIEASREFIRAALANARTSGYLPDQASLSEAIANVRSGMTSESYASAFEMRKANLILANQLGELQGYAGEQLTTAERQLAISERQLEKIDQQIANATEQYNFDVETTTKYYEDMLESYQKQIDAINGVNNSVLSLRDAIMLFSGAVKNTGITTPSSFNESTYLRNKLSAVQAVGEFKGKSATDLKNYMATQGMTPYEHYLMYGISEGIKAYANGGYSSGGMALVGENGPELVNFENPAMVYNSAQTNNLISNSVTQEIRGLREDNKTQARAMVQLQTRMNRLLERWDGDGLPEERVVTA